MHLEWEKFLAVNTGEDPGLLHTGYVQHVHSLGHLHTDTCRQAGRQAGRQTAAGRQTSADSCRQAGRQACPLSLTVGQL